MLSWYSVGGGSHQDYQRMLKDTFSSVNVQKNQTESSALTLKLAAVIPTMTIRQAEKIARQTFVQKRRLMARVKQGGGAAIVPRMQVPDIGK